MQSLLSSPGDHDRPQGVAVVAALLVLLSAGGFALAALLWAHFIPLAYGSSLLPAGLEQSGPVAFLIYGTLTFILAYSLWSRRNWARRVTVLLAAVGVALAVPAISSAVADGRPASMVREGLQIMVRITVIYYLSQEPVRDWFSAQQ